MNLDQNQTSLKENILAHISSIREKIESNKKQIPYRNGYIKTLRDIEEALSNQPLDLNRLRRDKFGIFRMVDGNADTPIDKELMLLHEEIHDLIIASEKLRKE